jgi:general secretion pathway protein B
MSFILDALKKAEAERHLGQIPTLHMQPLATLPAASAPNRAWKALLAAFVVLLFICAGLLVWLRPWQMPHSPAQNLGVPTPAPSSATAAPEGIAAGSNVSASPAQQLAAVAPVPDVSKSTARPPIPAKTTATVASRPPAKTSTPPPSPVSVANEAPASNRVVPSSAATRVANDAPSVPATITAASPAADTPSPQIASKQQGRQARQTQQTQAAAGDTDLKMSTAYSPEPSTPSQRELPEQIQRELPNLAIGGYIYSDNPRERQLLVNKRLLHEGEEAATGVILEKMTPKSAVFNYKGYRYRIAY